MLTRRSSGCPVILRSEEYEVCVVRGMKPKRNTTPVAARAKCRNFISMPSPIHSSDGRPRLEDACDMHLFRNPIWAVELTIADRRRAFADLHDGAALVWPLEPAGPLQIVN